MILDYETEQKIAETAFCFLDYGNYGSEENAVKAFRRRKGMSKHDTETVRTWLSVALQVRKRLEEIKVDIAKSYGKKSHCYLNKEDFDEGTRVLFSRLSQEFPKNEATVSYMISMAWHMYYLR